MFKALFDFVGYGFDAIEKHVAFILLVVTSINAYIAYNSTKIMKQQLEVDVKISDTKLGTDLKEKRFVEQIIKNKELENKHIDSILVTSICNRAAGNCSVSKPYLILNFPDGYEVDIKPKSKEIEIQNIGDTTKEIIKDFGNTVYLKSRDIISLELEYKKILTEALAQHIRDYSEDIKYFMEYVDNFENKHRILLENVYSRDELRRY